MQPLRKTFRARFRELYPAAAVAEMAALLQVTPAQLDREFERAVRLTVGWLDYGLQYHEMRPKPQDSARQIKAVVQRARALIEALQNLDDHARWELQDAFVVLTGPYKGPLPKGLPRVSEYQPEQLGERNLIPLLVCLIEAERAMVHALTRIGADFVFNKAEAAELLLELWRAYSKVEPTLTVRKGKTSGNFLRFCELILAPAFELNGLPVHLERAARRRALRTEKAKARSIGSISLPKWDD